MIGKFSGVVALWSLPVLAIVVAASAGTVWLPPGRTAAILLHAIGLGEAGDWPIWQETILIQVRLPRVLIAALAGGGLALAGATMQAIFRNPLADPGVIGVSGGASLGAVIAIYAGWASASVLLLPAAAFVGGLGAALLVYGIAAVHGRTSMSTLLLAGVAVGGMTISFTSFVLSLSLNSYELGRQMLLWLLGGMDNRTWTHVRLAAPAVLGATAWILTYPRDLNALLIGDDTALSVGVDAPRVRRNLLVLSTLITSAIVAVAGIIGFVGLIVPHMLRLIVGPDHRRLLPACVPVGAAFLVLTDLVCRTVPVGEELRLGVVTSLLGGPFFLLLLVRSRRNIESL